MAKATPKTDVGYLNLMRRIFDEFLGTPLPESVTTENALTIIPIMLDSLSGGTKDPGYDTHPTNPQRAPIDKVTTLNNRTAKLVRDVRALDARERHRELESRVSTLLGRHKKRG